MNTEESPILSALNQEYEETQEKIEKFNRRLDRIETARQILMDMEPEFEPRTITIDKQPKNVAPKGTRDVLNPILKLLSTRAKTSPCKIIWLVNKLAPKLQRENEDHRDFYKVVHAVLHSHAKRSKPHVKLMGRGLVQYI